MSNIRRIDYINKSFEDLRTDLVEYAKNYFPETYNDFSPASPGMMFIEMAAYVGDILSFYQDTQLQEVFVQHAKNPESLYHLAYLLGYRPKITTASQVSLRIVQEVDSIGPAGEEQPDWSQAGIFPSDIEIAATAGSGTPFFIREGVDFSVSSSLSPTEVIPIFEENSTVVEKFQLIKNTPAFSATRKIKVITIGNVQRFRTLTISDSNIIGVLRITDSSQEEWTEVPFLGQDTIAIPDNTQVFPNTLKLEKIPRRFVTRFTPTGNLQIQFGAGIQRSLVTQNLDKEEDFISNPENLITDTGADASKLDIFFDPTNFLFTEAYGLDPANTTLTIEYLVGGGVEANEESNSIDVEVESNGNTFFVTNPEPATGGKGRESLESIKQNSLRSFAEQLRVVTSNDFNVRAKSLPPSFGYISKAFTQLEGVQNSVERDLNIPRRTVFNNQQIALYVLSEDNNGKLIKANHTLKENLRKYLAQYIMLTDTVAIKDGYIINIGVNFDIVNTPNFNGKEVIARCIEKLKQELSTNRREINQPINIVDLYNILYKVPGVQSVNNIQIRNIVGEVNGRLYSEYEYDIPTATLNNVIYPSLDPCIFEVKYPNQDIRGRISTI